MWRPLLFGLLFGFLLSRAGATDPAAIEGMFRLTDLHLFGVIGTAVFVAGLGLHLLGRTGARTVDGRPARITAKPFKPGLVTGGLLFGIGWALTGACPGTSLAQVGEGRWPALFTSGGILLGTLLYGRIGGHIEGWLGSLRRPAAAPVTAVSRASAP